MGFDSPRFVRFKDDLEYGNHPINGGKDGVRLKYDIDKTQFSKPKIKKPAKEMPKWCRRSLKSEVLSRVFSDEYETVRHRIFDPRGAAIHRWTKILLVACIVSLFVDPLLFYLPKTWKDECIDIGLPLEVTLTFLRSVADVFYIIQIFIRFRTAYIAPSSRVLGRGELVVDPRKIATRYLQKNFWIDLLVALPLPQVLLWIVIPSLGGSTITNTKIAIRLIIIFQYLPRLFLIFPLSSQIEKATGLVTETAWAGAAYNLMLYMLASHVLGACWYLLSIEREEACWISVCNHEPLCQLNFLACQKVHDPLRDLWLGSSNITNVCNPSNNYYQFGIYGDALTFSVTSSSFFNKYFYCLWWGLKNLSSLGQNLATSTHVGEIIFSIIVATLGLVLFGLLIGNMQTYLQSTTIRLEEMRIKRTDTEQWMQHRQLPQELRDSIRKYDQYKWVATRGVDEEALLKDLPADLRRDIKRHLCLDLVRRVPLFDQMDERMLDAICDRLKPALCNEGTFLVREGDLVDEMLFIIRGNLDSFTTNGGRTGFFNICQIGPGDFCGEELLTWALDPRINVILPSSTRTVKAISEVEAFALSAEDLKFVASQFRRLHSKQLRHTFRFYSHQWRMWAACFIQAAWRRYKKRKEADEIQARENPLYDERELDSPTSGLAMCKTRSAASTRNCGMKHSASDPNVVCLQKPSEPDFSVDED